MLNFAFIGCGKAARFHADVIYALGHSISAVSARENSLYIKKFSSDYGIRSSYSSWYEMLEKERPDALIIAVTWDQTESIIEDIILRRIPCLIEKPVALTSQKLEQIVLTAQKYNKNVLVGYNRRFYDFVPLFKQAIQTQTQELISIELNFPETASSLAKQFSAKIIDYILPYITSHWLDLLIYLIGDVELKYMHRRSHQTDAMFQAYNGALFSSAYNVPIHLQANFNAPSQTSITFNFKDIIYKLCPMEVLTIYQGMEVIEPNGTFKIRRYVPKTKQVFAVDTAYKPGFYLQMENFINTCITRQYSNQIGATLEDALRVTRLCEEIEGKL